MFLTNPFDNPANWNLVWDIDITAEGAMEGAFIAIPRLKCPLLLSYPIVCIEVSNPYAKPHWRRAGFALQEIRTGILVGGNPETMSSVRQVYLDELNFVTFNNDVDGYSLYFKPLFWHRQIILKAWEFTAKPQTTSTNAINSALREITNQLSILTTKVNGVETTITQLATKIEAVETIVTEIDANVDEIDANVDEIDANVDEIDANVDEIDANVDEIDANVDEIDANVDEMNNKLDTVGIIVTEIQEDLNSL